MRKTEDVFQEAKRINKKIVLKENDVVAVIPPVSGG